LTILVRTNIVVFMTSAAGPAHDVLTRLSGGLVVSCQALPHEPLYTEAGGVMPLLAEAARQAGAVGIRANSARDVAQIRAAVPLPVIGLIKQDYPPYEPFITVTMAEVDALVAVGAEIVAVELTGRTRPDGLSPAEWVATIRRHHPDLLLMADIATYGEGIAAAEAGVDLVGTTLSGYTPQSLGDPVPNLDLVRRLAEADVRVVAEGRIHTPEQARASLDAGAHCVVVGGAITRPLEIATRFVQAMTAPAT
jgi:N-acylglucosamine-6-phosphate 2-epimerase